MYTYGHRICIFPNPISALIAHLVPQKTARETVCMYVNMHVYIHVFSHCIGICPNSISAQKAHLVPQKTVIKTVCMYECIYVYIW